MQNEQHSEFGAEWWKDMLSRREANKRLVKLTALSAMLSITGIFQGCDIEDEQEVSIDTTELQRQEGWNVGSPDKPLVLNGRTSQDSLNSLSWSAYLDPEMLLKAYEPSRADLKPFVVATLVQALSQPSLKGQMSPIFTPAMQTAYSRGLGMKELLKQSKDPENVALVVDIAGAESVAFGAALADVTHLVICFDNWPHPIGVVPSQETLGAMLYFAEEVSRKAKTRPEKAPAVFLLDSNRLAPYNEATDAETKFDNRYMAKIPSAENFEKLGFKSVLYCSPDESREQELDDLNDDFASYKEKGLAVSMIKLSDFKPLTTEVSSVNGAALPKATVDSSQLAASTAPTEQRASVYQTYYYGGFPGFAPWFFFYYPMFLPSPIFYPRYNYGYYRSLAAPRAISRPNYTPVRRPTMFSGRTTGAVTGVGRVKPTGFGRVSTRISSTTGRITGIRAGRFGSFGRSRSGFFS
ncbi:MAG: hypothetical protein ACK41G_01405 [Candidatus Thermochlorobacter sp.]